jgi:hypothetical protein
MMMNKANSFNCSLRVFVCCLILTIFFNGCSLINNRTITKGDYKVVKKEQLVFYPFTFEPTVANFCTHFKPSYKLKIFTKKNTFYPSAIDSIYRFSYKKSELFIYKAYERELFVGGSIFDNIVVLRNGIRVGISRKDFFSCFSDLKSSTDDTIRITSKKGINSFNFIFKKDKLKAIKIDNYID